MPSPFDDILVGQLGVPNRFAMAPMKTAFGDTSGNVTARHLAYFRRRAEGGVGLILSEPFYVDKKGQEHSQQLGIDSDRQMDGLRNLVDVVHRNGSRVFAHLNHGGRAANPQASESVPEAPSNIPNPHTGVEPEVLTEARIEEIIHSFSRAARRAKLVGFDGVELQFGLGYLVSQFLSPVTNQRKDKFGGELGNRLRFAQEVFAAVRRVVGDTCPISVRISGSEKSPNGLEIDDAIELALHLELWGADLIHVVTGSICESRPWYFQHMSLPPGVNEELAAKIKDSIRLPVMASGRLGDPVCIRKLINQDRLDMVALGRPLLTDPDLPNKMKQNKDDDVLLCGHCLQACLVGVQSGRGIACNINPEVGHEREKVLPAAQRKHIVVVGGGPAGLQAAITARHRGHRVTLFENRRLGGQFTLAYLAPGKRRIEQSFRSLIIRVSRSGAELRVGEEATAEKLMALKPEVVILATGSRPVTPDIPGLKDAVSVKEVFTNGHDIGHNVLIVGGGTIAMEVAEYLAQQGTKCTILKRSKEVALESDPITLKLALTRLSSLPVFIYTEPKIICVENNKAIVEFRGDQWTFGPFDSVVATSSNESYDPLSDQIDHQQFIVKRVGDAEKPGRIYDAILSGHQAAMSIQSTE